MKIRPEHYIVLRDAIRAIPNTQREAILTDVQRSPKRRRWDLLWASGTLRFVCDTLYSYVNDDHIDTALRAIEKEVTAA